MALQKYSADAAVKTVGPVEANFLDLLMPHTELVGSANNFMRSAAYTALGYTVRGVVIGTGWNPFNNKIKQSY